jgi:hypothetical protein
MGRGGRVGCGVLGGWEKEVGRERKGKEGAEAISNSS